MCLDARYIGDETRYVPGPRQRVSGFIQKLSVLGCWRYRLRRRSGGKGLVQEPKGRFKILAHLLQGSRQNRVGLRQEACGRSTLRFGWAWQPMIWHTDRFQVGRPELLEMDSACHSLKGRSEAVTNSLRYPKSSSSKRGRARFARRFPILVYQAPVRSRIAATTASLDVAVTSISNPSSR